jgi:putative NADH-flavin reductase
MQIPVFGAGGKVGRLVVAEALACGYTVVAFVHSHNPFEPDDNLVLRQGDVYNTDDVAAAIQGSEAVISCLGSWGTKGRDVLSRFTRSVIPAMEQQKIMRLVTLTGIGVQTHPGKLSRTLLRAMNWLPFGKVFNDAEQHVQLLNVSSLDWTAVCSPVMNNWGGTDYRLSVRLGNPLGTINRRAVATALLEQLQSGNYTGQAPVIHRK